MNVLFQTIIKTNTSVHYRRLYNKFRDMTTHARFRHVGNESIVRPLCCNCKFSKLSIKEHKKNQASLYQNIPMKSYSTVDSDINSERSENEFEIVCEDTLDSLTDRFEDLAEDDFTSEDFDVNFSGGVLTVKLGDSLGTYVINKQTPNKQIWLSSPLSGPKRYDMMNNVWIYKHDGVTLHQLLTDEISRTYKQSIDFRDCVYGGADTDS